MSRYRKVDPKFWADEKVRAFSDDGKLGFLYVVTHPHLNAIGAMRASLEGLAAELGWSPRRLRVALEPAMRAGMIEYDATACFIALPRFLKYNDVESPNGLNVWVGALDLVPECQGKERLIARCRAHLEAKSEGFRNAIPDAIRDAIRDAIGYGQPMPSGIPCRIQELELEPELELELEKPPNPLPGDAHAWLEVLNREARRSFKTTIKSNLTPILARMKDGHTLEQAEVVVKAKVTEWQGTEFAKFLRPATIFGPKFDGYLQAALSGNGNSRRGVNAAWEDPYAKFPRD
jgi:uncharacterized phage protein (TIGR02220 family)